MYNDLDKHFIVKEEESALKQFKQNKATGLDLLLNKFFIHGKSTSMPIFN